MNDIPNADVVGIDELKFVTAKVPILDGLCQLYTRPNSKYWWAVFYHKRKAVSTSTKETDIEKAKAFARLWYMQTHSELTNGFAPAGRNKSFSTAADKALAAYEKYVERGVRSQKYLHGLRKVVVKLKQTSIANIDIADINQKAWNAVQSDLLKANPEMTSRTMHQYKNCIQVTLKQAMIRGEIDTMPRFISQIVGIKEEATTRTYFPLRYLYKLMRGLEEKIEENRKNYPRYLEAAEELHDYVILVAATGMRPGEAMNVRFRDVQILDDEDSTGRKHEYLYIKNITGKRTTKGRCKSLYGKAVTDAFRRCITRHGLTVSNLHSSDNNVFKGYHRDMFREVLIAANLYKTNDRPPLRRDLMSLRHTHICFRLSRKVPAFNVAKNCRTSVDMIEKHYASFYSPNAFGAMMHKDMYDSDQLA